jgi:hypothetical protein
MIIKYIEPSSNLGSEEILECLGALSLSFIAGYLIGLFGIASQYYSIYIGIYIIFS